MQQITKQQVDENACTVNAQRKNLNQMYSAIFNYEPKKTLQEEVEHIKTVQRAKVNAKVIQAYCDVTPKKYQEDSSLD